MGTAAEMKNRSLDAKREEFRKYLEKEGVLEYLTKHLVLQYEKTDKPTSALEYLKSNFAVELKESVPEETPAKATETEDEPMETEENEKASEEPAKSVDESEKKTDEEQ